jgi:hypothetical protein
MRGCAVAGHRDLCSEMALRDSAAIDSSPGFIRFAAQTPVRQRSLSADLIFWLLFYQEKSNSPLRQLSGFKRLTNATQKLKRFKTQNYLPPHPHPPFQSPPPRQNKPAQYHKYPGPFPQPSEARKKPASQNPNRTSVPAPA